MELAVDFKSAGGRRKARGERPFAASALSLALLAMLGCAKSEPQKPAGEAPKTTTVAPPPAAAKTPASEAPKPPPEEAKAAPAAGDGHDHGMPHGGAGAGHAEAGEHAHGSPHGGLVVSTSGGHLELLANREGSFKLWLLDDKQGLRPVTGTAAKIKVAQAGYADVDLSAAGDHLEGKGATISGEHAAAVVTVTTGDKVETARFKLHLEAGKH